jgi:molybdate transport system permease protein
MPLDLTPLWISLKVAGLATLLAFCVGTAAAYGLLGYRGPGKSLLEGLFVAPLVLPPTVVGFLLLVLLGRSGPFAPFLQALGVQIVFTWYGAVISATVVAFPLMYRTALGAFEQVDTTLIQVARTLGAREQRIFWQIVLPLAAPGLLAGMTLSFARALGEFGATLMVAGNIPGRTQTMPMAIYFAVQAGAMAQAWGWVAIIMVVSLSGILATNIWQTQQRPCQGKSASLRPQPPEGKGTLNRDPLPPFWEKGLGDDGHELAKVGCPPGELRVTANYPRPATTLEVDIYKPLATFPLAVRFNAGPESLGILGASGSGKSMTLRCIAGVETPDQGRIVLNGRVLFDSQIGINVPSHQRRVGLLFQSYGLFPHLTIADNIGFGLHHLPRRERQKQVSGWLRAMHLQGLGHGYPQQLSGGQQQRVALARALAPNPEVLLLDEPLSALDTYLRSQVEQHLITTLATYPGLALFVSHNLEEVFRICPQIMVMAAGQSIIHGSRHGVFEQPGSPIAAQITGCKNFSRATPISAHTIHAGDWGCTLTVAGSLPDHLSQVGFRAHQIEFVDHPHQPNTLPAWVVSTSETPHRITLFLKLHRPPSAEDGSDPEVTTIPYDLQAEVFKEKWQILKSRPFPWYVHLAPERVLLLSPAPRPSETTHTVPQPTIAPASKA